MEWEGRGNDLCQGNKGAKLEEEARRNLICLELKVPEGKKWKLKLEREAGPDYEGPFVHTEAFILKVQGTLWKTQSRKLTWFHLQFRLSPCLKGGEWIQGCVGLRGATHLPYSPSLFLTDFVLLTCWLACICSSRTSLPTFSPCSLYHIASLALWRLSEVSLWRHWQLDSSQPQLPSAGLSHSYISHCVSVTLFPPCTSQAQGWH